MERMSKIRGFSLIELIAVMLVLVIIAVTVYFKWSSISINPYAQAAQLANDIRYTQNLSMTKRQKFRLAITSATTYQIQDENNNPVTISSRGTTITLENTITFGTPTGIISKIIFNPKGTPYNDAQPSVPLTSNAIIPLVASNKTVDVTITPNTGRVTP